MQAIRFCIFAESNAWQSILSILHCGLPRATSCARNDDKDSPSLAEGARGWVFFLRCWFGFYDVGICVIASN
ncbi:hypothetical protein [Helicobacter sp. T3_23-1056]